MKHLGVLLTGGVILFVILVVAVFSFFPVAELAQSKIVVPVDPVITKMQTNFAAEEATYQAQMTALEQARQQQDTAFQQQAQELNRQIMAAQQQLTDLQSQEKELLPQLEQLQTSRTERLHAYQISLEQTRQEYLTQQNRLKISLDQTQVKPGGE